MNYIKDLYYGNLGFSTQKFGTIRSMPSWWKPRLICMTR